LLVFVLSIRVEYFLLEHGAATIVGCKSRLMVLAIVSMDQGVASRRHAVVENAS
jgi:hypothetical protein